MFVAAVFSCLILSQTPLYALVGLLGILGILGHAVRFFFTADTQQSSIGRRNYSRPGMPILLLLTLFVLLIRVSPFLQPAGLIPHEPSSTSRHRYFGSTVASLFDRDSVRVLARVSADTRRGMSGGTILTVKLLRCEDSRGVFLDLDGGHVFYLPDGVYYRGQILSLPVALETVRPVYGSESAGETELIQYDANRDILRLPAPFIAELRASIRERSREALAHLGVKTQSYINALLLGDRSSMGAGVSELYRRSGLMHLFVLSGFHLGILYFMCQKFLPGFLGPAVREILSNSFIWVFIALVSPGASALRASLAIALYSLIKLSSWTLNRSHQLALLWNLLLLASPESARQLGAFLSFAAIWGLVFLRMPLVLLIHRINYYMGNAGLPSKWLKAVAGAFIPSAAASLAVMPLSLVFFGSIAPQGIIALPIVIIPFYACAALCAALLFMLIVFARLTAVHHVLEWALEYSIRFLEAISRPFAFLGDRIAANYLFSWLTAVTCLGGLICWILYCRRSGLLLSSGHVQLRFGEGYSGIS